MSPAKAMHAMGDLTDPTHSNLFRIAGALPPTHKQAAAMVRKMIRKIPTSPLSRLWALAFRDFLAAETPAERAAARENIVTLHAAVFRIPASLLIQD